MLYSLLLTALLMGVAGIPHCGAMCAAPCAAVLPRGVPLPAVLGRTLGYAGLGALAAGAMGLVSAWSRWAVAIQPIWVMLLAATALLGGWMALKGAMPGPVQAHGLRWYRRLHAWVDASPLLTNHPGLKALVPWALGLAWAALPCGLLYGAVTVAALAGSPGEGALVMAVFSLPGAMVLWWLPRRMGAWRAMMGESASKAGAALQPAVAPVLWHPSMRSMKPIGPGVEMPALAASGSGGTVALRTAGGAPRPGLGLLERWPWLADPRWAVRFAGAFLCAAASWALVHRLHEQWLAWCA